MTVRELFEMADELATNALPARTKLFEYNRLEKRIRVDILGEDPQTAADVTEDNIGSAVPVLPERYHDVYLFWMASMIFFHQGETEAYENERQMFEAAWIRFERDVCIALDRDSTDRTSIKDADREGY